MQKKLLLITVLTLIIFSVSVQAVYVSPSRWNDSAGDQDYHNPVNWTLELDGSQTVPANDPCSEYDCFVENNGPGPVVTLDTTVNVVLMGGWDANPQPNNEMTFTSGTYNVLFWCIAGFAYGSDGTFNVNGGTLNVGTDLMVGAHHGGAGILNVTSGEVNASQLLPAFLDGAQPSDDKSSGIVNLDGGAINITNPAGGLVLNERSTFNITGGTLTQVGNHRWGFSDLASWNLLEAYGGTGTILLSYDAGTNLTTVTATAAAQYIDKFDTYADTAALKAVWDDTSSSNASISLDTGHNDSNSLKIDYDNTASPYVAETSKTFSPAMDFTALDMVALDLWFNGQVGNSVEQMYVILEDGTAATQTINYGDGNGNIAVDSWIRWVVPYGTLSVDPTDIVKITIGIGEGVAGGTGTVLFDSLVMYGSRGGVLQADINGDDRVNLEDFAIMAGEWLDVSL